MMDDESETKIAEIGGEKKVFGVNFKRQITAAYDKTLHYLHELFVFGGIHGWTYVFNQRLHLVERLLWLALIIGFSYSASYLVLTTYDRYQANPVVVSLENYYNNWNGTVPAITYCYHVRIDMDQTNEYILKTWGVKETDKKYSYFLEYVNTVVNVSAEDLSTFKKYASDSRLAEVNMLEIATAVHPNYDDVITSFDKQGNLAYIEVITERGICYMINSPLSMLLSTLMREKDFKIAERSLSCQFARVACFIKIDLQGSIAFAVHSPYDLPVEGIGFVDIKKQDEIETMYSLIETVAGKAVRGLRPKQRRCLFPDEPNQMSTLPVYGVKYCGIVCKAYKSIELCGCKPFFYPFISGKVCGPEGLYCLSQKGWPENVMSDCECPKACTEVLYMRESMKSQRWVVAGFDASTIQRTSVRWEIKSPNFRLRRDVLFSFEDLLVSFGGIATLFLGFSMYSLLRMCYFIAESIQQYFHRKTTN